MKLATSNPLISSSNTITRDAIPYEDVLLGVTPVVGSPPHRTLDSVAHNHSLLQCTLWIRGSRHPVSSISELLTSIKWWGFNRREPKPVNMDKSNPLCACACRVKSTWSQISRMLSWHAQKNSLNLSTMWLSYLDLASLPGLTTGEIHYYTISSQLVSIVQLSLQISCNITQLCPRLLDAGPSPLSVWPSPLNPQMGLIIVLHSFLPPQTCLYEYHSHQPKQWGMENNTIFLRSENHPHHWQAYMYCQALYNAKTVVAIMHYVFCVANCMQTVDTSVGYWHSICTILRLTLRQKCRMTSWVEGGLHNP